MRPTTIASVSDVVLLWTRDLAFWKKNEKMVDFDVFLFFLRFCHNGTHLKFNIAPEKLPSQKESNLPTIIFQGLC